MKYFNRTDWKDTFSKGNSCRAVLKNFVSKLGDRINIQNIRTKAASHREVLADLLLKAKNRSAAIKGTFSKAVGHTVITNILSKTKNSSIGIENIPFHRFYHSYKRQLAVLMMLVIFLATGIMGTSGAAVSPDDGQASDLVPAYKVSLDGKVLVYVSDPASVQTILAQMLRDAQERYGMDVSLDQEISFDKMFLPPARLSLPEDTAKTVRGKVKINCNAYTIYANDVRIGTLKSREEADKLLDRIKSQYAGGEKKPESAAFQEKIKILFTPVPFDQVRDIDTIVAEIAKGRETVEEYTIANGDNLWTISRSHDMDLDTLVAMNSDIQDLDKLKLGQKLRLSYPKSPLNVVTTEVVQYEEAVPFETETREDGSMYKNQTKVLQEGKDGRKKIEARVKKINGIEESRTILSEQVTQEPVKKVIAKGTKTLASMASRGGGALLWPARGSLSSGFGRRWGRMHEGIDIANSVGTPIYAADPGKVIFTGRSSGYGNLIRINHGGGLVTCYGHLKSFAVSSGQYVDRGQLIGYMGNTGNSTGPHLHFEVRVNNSPQNPIKYLP